MGLILNKSPFSTTVENLNPSVYCLHIVHPVLFRIEIVKLMFEDAARLLIHA